MIYEMLVGWQVVIVVFVVVCVVIASASTADATYINK